jgi:hypothetical protein
MKYQTIIEERHGAVARLITNRPQYKNGFCRKVDSNPLLSTISGIFRARTFQYMV